MARDVIVASARSRSGGQKVYHTGQCANYPSRPMPRDLDKLDADEWGECQLCSGEYVHVSQSRDWSYQESLMEAADARR